MSYEAFAKRILASGVVTDPWLGGLPRFREAPVVLDHATATRMADAAAKVAEVYNETCLIVADAPEVLDSFFGLSPWQKAMWMASQPLWHGIARADVFVTDDGSLQIAELNCDTPTGEAEATVLGALARETNAKCTDPNVDLVARFVDVGELIAKNTLRDPRQKETLELPKAPRRVGIVYPTEFPEDLSLVRLYKSAFEKRGWQVVLGSPFNLDSDASGRLRLFEEPISLMVRHYKTDWWSERESVWTDEELPDKSPLDKPLEAVLAAMLAGTCAVVNPFGAVVPQNKRAMAFMWEQIHRYSRRGQEIIRALVPFTRRLEAFHVEQLVAQKDDWVLKSDYGAEGDEVVVGRAVSDEAWGRSLSLARKGRWIVQRFFQAQRSAEGEIINHGIYVIAGEPAGIYARVQAGPTDEHALSAPVLLAP